MAAPVTMKPRKAVSVPRKQATALRKQLVTHKQALHELYEQKKDNETKLKEGKAAATVLATQLLRTVGALKTNQLEAENITKALKPVQCQEPTLIEKTEKLEDCSDSLNRLICHSKQGLSAKQIQLKEIRRTLNDRPVESMFLDRDSALFEEELQTAQEIETLESGLEQMEKQLEELKHLTQREVLGDFDTSLDGQTQSFLHKQLEELAAVRSGLLRELEVLERGQHNTELNAQECQNNITSSHKQIGHLQKEILRCERLLGEDSQSPQTSQVLGSIENFQQKACENELAGKLGSFAQENAFLKKKNSELSGKLEKFTRKTEGKGEKVAVKEETGGAKDPTFRGNNSGHLETALQQIAHMFGIETQGCSQREVSELVASIQYSKEQLDNDLRKAERFKKNKDKFLKLYTATTQDLEGKLREISTQRLLPPTRGELCQQSEERDRLSRRRELLKAEKTTVNHHSPRLRDDLDQSEALKVKEYRKLQELNKEETLKYQSTLKDLKSLKLQIPQLLEEKSQLEQAAASFTRTITRQKEKHSLLTYEVHELETAIHKLKNNLTEEQQAAQSELSQTTSNIHSKHNELNKLYALVSEYEEKTHQLQDSHKALRTDCNSETIRQNDLETENKALLNKIKDANTTLSTLEHRLKTVQEHTESASLMLRSKEKQLKELETYIANRHTEITGLDASYNENSSKLERLIEELSTSSSKLYELGSSYSAKSLALQSLQAKINNTTCLIHEKAKLLQTATCQLSAASSALQQRQAQLKPLTAQSTALSQEVAQLQLEVRHTKDSSANLCTEERVLAVNVENMRNLLESGESSLKNLMLSLETHKEQYSQEKLKLSRLQEELLSLDQEKTDSLRELSALKHSETKLQDRLNALYVQEQAALVLLGLAGHKTQEVKATISALCKHALAQSNL